MPPPTRILVVEDDRELAQALELELGQRRVRCGRG
jgi:DNA-binding response OmpR family regulator